MAPTDGRGESALYVVATWVPRRTTITVGSLGPVRFARHLRADKPLRWHADYLFAVFPGRLAWLVDGELTECELAGALAGVRGAARRPPRFGAGDCCCAGHLVALATRPDTTSLAAAAGGCAVLAAGHLRG